MWAMCVHITFPKTDTREELVLTKVSAVEFESSWKEPVSKGKITFPRNVRLFNSTGSVDQPEKAFRELFKRGDEVIVQWGYNNQMTEEFRGYVTTVSANIPVEIMMEDEMFKIKRMPVNFSHPDITLQKLLDTIIPGYDIDALEGVTLGSVRLAKTQVGPVLEKLQQDWGLYTYWKKGKLYSGKYYQTETDTEAQDFHLERNCVSTSLNYKRKEDIKLKIKAVSTLPNGSKIEVDGIGDMDGDERQLTFYNVTDVKELRVLGELEYDRFKVDGFDGSLTAFGIPTVTHGMKARLQSGLYKEREGLYYIDKVFKSFDQNGIRQEITLGQKVEQEL